MQVSAHFTREELADRESGEHKFSQTTLDRLERVRVKCGFPFKISSGYRTPEHNAAVSATGLDGPHTTGQAVDVVVGSGQAYKLVAVAIDEGFTGIGVQQKGDTRFIHLDDLPNTPASPRPAIWSY